MFVWHFFFALPVVYQHALPPPEGETDSFRGWGDESALLRLAFPSHAARNPWLASGAVTSKSCTFRALKLLHGFTSLFLCFFFCSFSYPQQWHKDLHFPASFYMSPLHLLLAFADQVALNLLAALTHHGNLILIARLDPTNGLWVTTLATVCLPAVNSCRIQRHTFISLEIL